MYGNWNGNDHSGTFEEETGNVEEFKVVHRP